MVRNWYARFPHITENADNLITNAEEAVEALKTGKIGMNVKPREKGRNNVYQQLPSLLDVTCCVRLHNLLRVVGSFCAKFETSQTFEPTTPNISFVPWSPKRSATMLHRLAQLFQHCWGHARALHMVYNVLRVVTFPRCTADPIIIGSCFVHLHTTANTNATTYDNVGSCCVRLHVAFSSRTANIGPIVPALPDILSLKVATH